jgi:N-acetylmuramoyl-L-alanine amidase
MSRRLALAAALALAAPAVALGGTPEPPPPEIPPPTAPAPTPTAPTPSTPSTAPSEGEPVPTGPVLIAIDAGHGGDDPGAIGLLPDGTPTGLKERRDGRGRTLLLEKDVNLDVARRLRGWLRKRGYRTLMTRTRDRAGGNRPFTTVIEDLKTRVEMANRAPASLFVSIHMNAARARTARGAETYHFTVSGPAAEGLAGSIQSRLITRTGLPSRGVKRAGFYVLKHTTMPAALVEGGFLTNRQDAALLAERRFRARVAAGVGEGLQLYINEGGNLNNSTGSPLTIRYWVHSGQFRRRALVDKRVALLRSRGFDAVVRRRYSARANRVMFFAVAGQFAFLDNAKRLRSELRESRLPGIIGPAG